MTLQEFKDNYLITDAELLTIQLEYGEDNSIRSDVVTIRLNGRKVLSKSKYEDVLFSLQFKGMLEFDYHDTFDCKTISQSTFTKTTLGQFYLSLDPFHEDLPSEEDNMVIKSLELFFIDPYNVKHQIT
jgi:hypothetical protein